MADMTRAWSGLPDITAGRIVDAEVKDSRHLVYYLPDRPVVAVLDGDVVLDGSCFTVDVEAGTLVPFRRPVIGLRFLVW